MPVVLIIKKNTQFKSRLIEYLSERGYGLLTASDGKEGLQKAIETKPDVIVAGAVIPGFQTFDFVEKIRKNSELSTTPIICLLKSFDKNEYRRAMEAGADDALIMPFEVETLCKAITVRYRRILEISDRHYELNKPDNILNKEFEKENKPWIFIDTKENRKFVKIQDIKFITAEGIKTCLHLNKDEDVLIRKSVREWEQRLGEKSFVRVNRSTILNLNFIENISKWSSRTFLVRIYDTDEPLIISQRYSKKLKHLLK